MDAFVQLWCEHAGIVRVGPDCRKYGDPYQYAMAFHIVDGCAVFEGMCSPIPWSVLRLVRMKVEALGLPIKWYRRKGDQTRKVDVMHKDIPVWDTSLVGHKINLQDARFAQGYAALANGLAEVTVVDVKKVHDKKVRITLDLDDVS